MAATGPAFARAPYLSKWEARREATRRVKKEMRRSDGDYYELNRCVRYARNIIGCDYYYEYFSPHQDYADGTDEYCAGRMMVREFRRYYRTYGRHVDCDDL